MRTCIFALALIAAAQPAFAKNHSHRHAHRAAYHHARHGHHYARVRAIEPRAAQIFVRTNSTDRPFFSDPSFPNRAWSENQFANQNQFGRTWTQPAQQPFGFSERTTRVRVARATARNTALDTMIARHAAANGLPVALVHRVVKRESGYNARASHAGNVGLMQIRYRTARGIGYTGSAAGLLDPETNLTYAVRYLAGAYRAAGGNASRAVSLYASGYHGRGVHVARRRAIPADNSGWQSAPAGMRSGSARWTM
jgi:soluble lytic murein transglycosylase-like protein